MAAGLAQDVNYDPDIPEEYRDESWHQGVFERDDGSGTENLLLLLMMIVLLVVVTGIVILSRRTKERKRSASIANGDASLT